MKKLEPQILKIEQQEWHAIVPEESDGVVPAYYDYPKTIQFGDADFTDAEWGQTEGNRVKRQEMNERLRDVLGE